MAGGCLDPAPGPLEVSDCGGLHIPQHGPWRTLVGYCLIGRLVKDNGTVVWGWRVGQLPLIMLWLNIFYA